MNIYKKLFLVVALSASSLDFYAKEQNSLQKVVKKTQDAQNIDQGDEYDCWDFIEQAHKDKNFKVAIKIFYIQQARKSKELIAIKEEVTHPKYQKSIQDVDAYLSSNKKCLEVLYTILSKKNLTEEDITQFIPHFSQNKYLFMLDENDQKTLDQIKHAEKQEEKIELLKKLRAIEENRSKANLGNWIRNSKFSKNPSSIFGFIAKALENEEQEIQEKL